jgi:hypothetical protein
LKTRLYFTIFFILLISSCEKNDSPSYVQFTAKLTAFIVNNYTNDAKHLYLNEILKDVHHFNRNNPILDTNEIKQVLKIIQAVYNTNVPQKDTVFNIYKIHNFNCKSLNSINLIVQPGQPAINNLINAIFPTGNKNLDNLLYNYHFDSVRTYTGNPNATLVTLFTKNEYNLLPIESKFNELSIGFAEINDGCIGDGNTIELIRSQNSAQIIFSVGTGDCPAGCIYHKYWEFNVVDSTASFIKTYGHLK